MRPDPARAMRKLTPHGPRDARESLARAPRIVRDEAEYDGYDAG